MTDIPRETAPDDPYRRRPPTIDLPAGEYAPAPGTAVPDPEVAPTAIEPIAATGLDEAVPGDAKPAETPSEIHPAAPPAGEPASVEPAAATADPAPPPAEPRRRGAGSLLAASLVGGVVGAGIAVGADTYLRPLPQPLEGRIAALESRPRAAAFDPAPLERRVAALEGQAKTLADGLAAARAATPADATGRPAAAAPPTAPSAETAAALTPYAAPPAPDSGLREAVAALEPRIAALESKAGAAAPASALDEIGTRLAAVQAAQSGAEERGRAAASAVATLQGAIAGAGQRLAADDKRIGDLAAEVAKLPPGLMAAGLRAIVAGQATDSLRGGASLGPSLAALARLGAAEPTLAALRPYAAQPAPGAGQLAQEFKPLAEKILAEPEGATASLGDRLLRIADKVVTVRQVGDGSGRDIPGLVGRIEAALGRGALPEAAAAFDALPEPARRTAQDWAARLKARVAADEAARRIGAESLAALDAPSR